MRFLFFLLFILIFLLLALEQCVPRSCTLKISYSDSATGKTLIASKLISNGYRLVTGCLREGSIVNFTAEPSDPQMVFNGGTGKLDGRGALSKELVEKRLYSVRIHADRGCQPSTITLPKLISDTGSSAQECLIQVVNKPVRVAAEMITPNTYTPNRLPSATNSTFNTIERTISRVYFEDVLYTTDYLTSNTQFDEIEVNYQRGLYGSGTSRWNSWKHSESATMIPLGGKPRERRVLAVRIEARHPACPYKDFVEECGTEIMVVLVNRKDDTWYKKWKVDAALEKEWMEKLPDPLHLICPNKLDDAEYKRKLRQLGWSIPKRIPKDEPNHFHPDARFEMRTRWNVPNDGQTCLVFSCFGHQAIYDDNGVLIVEGISAGSADRGAPIISLFTHSSSDVRPWLIAAWLDGNPTHFNTQLTRPQSWRLDRGFLGQLKHLSEAPINSGPNLKEYLELRPPLIDDQMSNGPKCE